MRILIADDWPNVQNALRVLLEQQPGLEVAGEVVDAAELLARLREDCPDVLLLGWELPGVQGSDLLAAVRRACPELWVIALSGRPDARRAALAAGADAFVSKVAPPERLLSVLLALGRAQDGARHFPEGRPGEGHPRPARRASAPGDARDRATIGYGSTERRSTVQEVGKQRKETLRYVAIIAFAAVLLAAIAAGLTVSLVLIDQIPFNHIFPR